MSNRPHGKAHVSTRRPEPFAICDRCNVLMNLGDLQWQFVWTGNILNNTRLLVCDRCYDEPQDQSRARTLPPDPLPVFNARPPRFAVD